MIGDKFLSHQQLAGAASHQQTADGDLPAALIAPAFQVTQFPATARRLVWTGGTDVGVSPCRLVLPM